MRYIYTAITALLLGGMAAQAADYQPLVREGVRWINHQNIGGEDFYHELPHYAIEFHGDTLAEYGGVTHQYKKCYTYNVNYGESPAVVDYDNMLPVALVREEDERVYMIDLGKSDSEQLLYDFSSRQGNAQIYDEFGNSDLYAFSSPTVVAGHACSTYVGNLGMVIESVGLVSQFMGDLLWPKWYQVLGEDIYYGLDYLEDLDGNILYKSPWYKEPSTCQPLVREGVVWHYVYWNYDYEVTMYPYCTELNVQFKGDTTICGVQYKKCFLFDSPTLPDNALPVYYAREENGKVMFTQPRHQVVDTLHGAFMPEIPGEFFELNGETLVYDFSDMSSFAENIHAEIVSTSEVEVNGVPAKKYHLSLPDAYECDFVEGVGVDGKYGGVLFCPFIILSTGYSSRPCGLIKLTDLDGNVLYKGAKYDKYNSIDRVDDDASAAADPRWYDLLGHPFDSRPTQPGVYIHQGKKVVVK